jgi:hypothetical protein
MLLISRNDAGALLAAHVVAFPSLRAMIVWRRAARRVLRNIDGLVFARAMAYIGSAASGGFGVGSPARHLLLLTAWRTEDAFEGFSGTGLAAGACWRWASFAVVSTRGTHHGGAPLVPSSVPEGRFAALTLGRCRPHALPRFLREGARIGALLADAPGLLTACSAGLPLTGNCTVSVWESERAMLDFAYGRPDGHLSAVRAPILREQLNARLRVLSTGGTLGSGVLFPRALPHHTAKR